MNFVDFVKKLDRDLHDGCPRGAIQRIGRALDRAKGLELLLRDNDPSIESLKPDLLLSVSELHRAYLLWKKAATELRRSLAQSGLSLPDGSLGFTFTPAEIDALGRAAQMCQRASFPDHGSWSAAIEAHVSLWSAAVSMGWSDCKATISLDAPDDPDAAEFERHITTSGSLEELCGYRWLGILRGERAGILGVSFESPWEAIEGQAQARLGQLGLSAQKRGARSIVDELIRNDLTDALRVRLNAGAEKEAILTARNAYQGLLDTPPLRVERLIAVHVASSSAPLGLAVLDAHGEVVEHRELKADRKTEAAIKDTIARATPEAAVLPTAAEDSELLRKMERALAELPIERVHTAALGDAQQKLSFGPMAGAAVVLGRRALRPAREWSRVDPLTLGLGEYPRELDPQRLSTVLTETRALSAWGRRNSSKSGARSTSPGSAQRPVGKRLNPMVKTVRDLKAGMQVDGVVTNLTRFGAFVNIGLSTEAMIHVSQISTEFVEDPAQVLRVGQTISARVIEVIPEKNRIALSLKPPPERSDGRLTSSRPSGKEPPKTRSSALADLDALFKK